MQKVHEDVMWVFVALLILSNLFKIVDWYRSLAIVEPFLEVLRKEMKKKKKRKENYVSCKLSLVVRWGFSELEIINLSREGMFSIYSKRQVYICSLILLCGAS